MPTANHKITSAERLPAKRSPEFTRWIEAKADGVVKHLAVNHNLISELRLSGLIASEWWL